MGVSSSWGIIICLAIDFGGYRIEMIYSIYSIAFACFWRIRFMVFFFVIVYYIIGFRLGIIVVGGKVLIDIECLNCCVFWNISHVGGLNFMANGVSTNITTMRDLGFLETIIPVGIKYWWKELGWIKVKLGRM